MLVTRDYLDSRLQTWASRIIGTVIGSVAAMLLANLAATWAIVAAITDRHCVADLGGIVAVRHRPPPSGRSGGGTGA